MQIVISVLIGVLVGGGVAYWYRASELGAWPLVAVGILGGLLGLATEFWLRSTAIAHFACWEYLASGTGTILALFLWIVAQRLFLGDPPPAIHESDVLISR